jgi:transcriptional regulator with XRE-family HTH domain
VATASENEILAACGTAVRVSRTQRDISQEHLAELAGLHRTYVGSVERGDRNVSLLNIVRLARALGTSPSELLRRPDRTSS